MIGLRKKTLSGGLWKGRTTGPTFLRVQLAISYLVLPFQIYPGGKTAIFSKIFVVVVVVVVVVVIFRFFMSFIVYMCIFASPSAF